MKKRNKLTNVIKWVLFAIGLAGTGVAIYFDSQIFGEASIFNKSFFDNDVLNTLYQKIPALIRTVQIIALVMAAYYLLTLIMKWALSGNNRGKTIAKLFMSFAKWALAIVAVLFVLSAWGIDTTTLVASAGVLTLIVGLGAQSLVADIVAGLFIVFEGEFQVGDIVVINGWRGTVQEIGIRTTKIVDAGGNINIVNNSEITTIINQTQEISLASCTVGIEYNESIPRVELVIKENLEKIKKNIPAILEGPYYKGVSALDASSVNLLFVAKCKEEDIFQVQRDMNREFKILFDENGINIPFPQVVVNYAKENTNVITDKQKKAAQKFVEEQKEVSSGIELEEDGK
ncbi:MAG: mechanosensitive ion channel family protein [Clostridia bacterium]|nr:mechanosensitive ion channel family protein [Clostridia bacterium]